MLEIKDLTVAVEGHEILHNVNLTIKTGEAHALFEERVLQTHDTETHGAVSHIRPSGGLRRIKVDVDDIIERAHGHGDRLAESLEVERTVLPDMSVEDDGAEIANSGFLFAAIQGDFGAQIG